jgi:hypothetical protein
MPTWCADIEIQANEILHHKLTLNGYLAEFTGTFSILNAVLCEQRR